MKSNLFKTAHQMAKELKAANSHFTYRECFSIALKEAWTMKETTTYIIPDWFAGKNSITCVHFEGGECTPEYAFESCQIKGESEKALKVRLAVDWRGGCSILKEMWIPKSIIKSTNKQIKNNDNCVRDYCEGDCFEMSKAFSRNFSRAYC